MVAVWRASNAASMARGIVLGVVATLVVVGLGAYLGVEAGLVPANADGKPLRLERWAAKRHFEQR